MRAYVFNCDFNGYSIILSLSDLGFDVYALDSKRSVGTYSRFCTYKRIADPSSNENEFIRQLVEIGKSNDEKSILFPTNDEWVDAVSRNEKTLAPYFIFIIPERKVVNLLLDKIKFSQWVEQRYLAPRSYKDLKDLSKNAFPVIAKPISRRRADLNNNDSSNQSFKEMRFTVCPNYFTAKKNWKAAEKNGISVFFQQQLIGDSTSLRTVGIAALNGQVLNYVYGRKVRGYPLAYGDTVVGELSEIPQIIKNLTFSIVKELNYSGIAELEFFYQRKTDEYFLLEINPRSWSWNGAARASGNCLVASLFQTYLGDCCSTIKPNAQADLPFRYIKIFEDFTNLMLNYEKSSGLRLFDELSHNLQFIISGNAVISGFEKFDPLVSTIVFLKGLKYFCKSLVFKQIRRVKS